MADAESIFFAARQHATPAERAAYLDAACGGDADLRQRVERLLDAAPQVGSFLEAPAGPATGEFAASPFTGDYRSESGPGAVIAGRYTLVELIGEGGMGEVWVAKQTEPVKRKVALKLIKAGMDSKAVLQRFEVERQALALMDHPNIAKVLDGGLTPERRPFFVMELVNGLPLTKYCDQAKLTPRERLELFVPVCQAVQHAHQKGIVHRDLKPSNILVTRIDGKPVPKVIDFGVAKATGGRLTDESLSTQFGAVVGTLEYMAPEQAGYSGQDVDTRADVYSLGVILYELLTGLRPIDAKRLRQAALTEMIRIIQEEEPSKPSTRLSTAEALPSLAALRQTEPRRLTAMLRGELDWVVMKCLEKSRERRYETASGLARDVERYLADEVVEARPPSAGYRVRKFVRRNKGQVIAATLVLVTLIAGIAGTTWQAAERRREREVAQLRSSQSVQSALDRAEAALAANRLPDSDTALALIDSTSLADDVVKRYRTAVRDRDMAREMDEIYEQYWTVCPHETQRDAGRAKARYPQAFRRYGIALDELPTEEAANLIRQSRAAPALTDGLVTWFFLDPKHNGLRPLLDRLDPDEFRTSVRAAATAEQATRLRELTAKADGGKLPPVFAVMLASVIAGPDSPRILRAAWSRHPDSFAVALALTFPYVPDDDTVRDDERLGWCRMAVALRPTNALAHFYLSLALHRRSDKAGRLDALRRCIELAPRFANAHAELGHALCHLDRHDEAFAAFRQAVGLDADNVSGHAGLCLIHLKRNDWVAAASAGRAAVTSEQRIHADEGCVGSAATGVLAGYLTFGAHKWALGLMHLNRFHDLASLCDDLHASFSVHFGDEETFASDKLFPACAAVQAAAGRGVDPPPPHDRPRVRRLALQWLSNDLKVWDEALSKAEDQARESAHKYATRWQTEPLLADVRGDRIAELPRDEQDGWRRYWAEVAKLCARAAPAGPAKP